MEAAECGAAALGIVLAKHGRFVPLEELRVACGVSRNGSNAAGIIAAAEGYGLVAMGFKKDVAALGSLPLPAVVFWNFNHFVVVEGFAKKRVPLNDPASGPRAVPYEEFDAAYTGVVLTFEPGPDFRPGGVPPSSLAWLRARLRGAEGALADALFASALLIVPSLAVPALVRLFVDQVLVRSAREWVVPLLGSLLLAALARAALTFIQQRALLRLETRLALAMTSRFLWHVLRLPASFFAQRQSGEIGSRLEINDRVSQLLSRELATASLGAVVMLFSGVMMLWYSPSLTLVAALALALDVLALQRVARRRMDANQRLQQERGRAVGTAMAGLQMIETIKSNGSESAFYERWAGHYAKLANAEQDLALPTLLLSTVPSALGFLTSGFILGLGALAVMNGEMTLGTLVAFQLLTSMLLEPVTRLVDLGASLQEVESGLQRVDDVLRNPLDPTAVGVSGDLAEPHQRPQPPKLAGRLELKDVSFGYSPREPLLQGFSMQVEPGRRVALVGASGSGKSTVARLICGLYEPWSGEVLLDGRPRASIERPVLASSLAMVSQDVFLFHGTVRENVTLWDRTLGEARVGRAARDAAVHGEIAARPGGYETPVEEAGRNFSGGQRQRLAIARALAVEPTVLVLDEATSALDPLTEKRIDDNLRRRGCTCVIVAHRLSTIRDCDEIIVLDRGKVVQRGTHDELSGVDGPYSSLLGIGMQEEPS